ncbi:MAG: serine/threonine protein kinase, partial [Actinobacteria bacterium]|nr:serine/threonine protein kinase [Actinomycetota bacterium]
MVAEGRILSARYRLEERIAAGAMGTVFRAVDERLHRSVALKLLKDDLAEDERFIERFRREARSAAALSHPNVAGVFDYGEDDGCSYIVMELASGSDLACVLRAEGSLAPERSARIAGQIAAALAHAHSLGVVHRDIKPANVLVGSGDNIKVTDFGIARATGDSTLTATGSVLGTAHYLSPEQASGAPVGPESDIYSLGIVLFEMLTGAVPFTGDSAISVAMKHMNEDVPAPSELNPHTPAHLDEVVRRATQKDPAARFTDAGAMSAALLGEDAGADTAPMSAPVMAGAAAATLVGGAGEAEATGTLVENDDGTSVLPTDSETPLVTASMKRWAGYALAGLAALALLVALVSAFTGDEPEGARRAGTTSQRSERPTGSTDEPFRIPSGLYDTEASLFVAEAAEAGFRVKEETVPTDELDPGRILTVSPG